MSDKIFESQAPLYWGMGFSALPVMPRTKGTKVSGWTQYCQMLPKEDVQAELLKRHPGHGIGLALGRALEDSSQLGFVDVDSDGLRRFVEAFVGLTPCSRVGKKGVALAVRLADGVKSQSIAFHGGVGAIDILGNKKMVVLPPTVHPDTNRPYQWVGRPLLECDPAQFPLLTKERCELLRKVVSHKSVPQILTGQTTNEATFNLTNSMVGLGFSKDELLRLVPLLFPQDYQGNSLQQLESMVVGAFERGYHLSAQKAKEENLDPQQRLILWGQLQHLYLDVNGNGFISLKVEVEINNESA